MVIDFDENMPSFNLDTTSTNDFDPNAWSSIWTGPISTYNLVTSSSNASNGEFINRLSTNCLLSVLIMVIFSHL